MITLKHTEDMNLPRSARSYIDSCATEFCDADESTKIAELAYRLKRGVDLLPVFIEDIKQHMEHPAYGEYEDRAKRCSRKNYRNDSILYTRTGTREKGREP